MEELILKFKNHVMEKCNDPKFIHHKWYLKYHLEIIERLVEELYLKYPDADKNILDVMVWLHDYDKILGINKNKELALKTDRKILLEIGFDEEFVNKVSRYVEIMDEKKDLKNSAIEIQIMSSVDGVAHLIGPFFSIYWYENSEKEIEELLEDNIKKALKDWDKKVVLKEIRDRFQSRHDFLMEQFGKFPERFFD
ncbi:MAG: hypothetical protein IH845_04310 [Nanoarchaeota archaeon]|nr:hypothetical protein [Nanoarchaeota archaeon]